MRSKIKDFSIKEMSNATGVPVYILRYLEKHGLFTVERNEDNNYRLFSISDNYRILHCQLLRSLGFKVEDAISILDNTDHEKYLEMLETRARELDEEIERLMFARRRVWDMADALKHINSSTDSDSFFFGRRSALYGLVSTSETGFVIPKAEEAQMTRYMVSELPYTFMSFVASKERVLGDQTAQSDWMMLTPKHIPERFSKYTVCFEECDCIFGIIKVPKFARIEYENLKPLLDYMDSHNMVVDGPAMGCICNLNSVSDPNTDHSYLTASIPYRIVNG